MKQYHIELMEIHPQKNTFQERVNLLAKEGWLYVNHVFVREYTKSTGSLTTVVFSVVLERDSVSRTVSVGEIKSNVD
jgi:hypothetical protein